MKAIVVEVPLVKGKQRDAVRGAGVRQYKSKIYSTIDKEATDMH